MIACWAQHILRRGQCSSSLLRPSRTFHEIIFDKAPFGVRRIIVAAIVGETNHLHIYKYAWHYLFVCIFLFVFFMFCSLFALTYFAFFSEQCSIITLCPQSLAHHLRPAHAGIALELTNTSVCSISFNVWSKSDSKKLMKNEGMHIGRTWRPQIPRQDPHTKSIKCINAKSRKETRHILHSFSNTRR